MKANSARQDTCSELFFKGARERGTSLERQAEDLGDPEKCGTILLPGSQQICTVKYPISECSPSPKKPFTKRNSFADRNPVAQLPDRPSHENLFADNDTVDSPNRGLKSDKSSKVRG
jgi:hypothetical protein